MNRRVFFDQQKKYVQLVLHERKDKPTKINIKIG